MMLLSGRDLTVQFGGLKALNGLSFSVAPHEVLGVLGANGSGKTTLVNVISGLQRATGELRLADGPLLGLPAHRRRALGISRTFQNLELSPKLTVRESLHIGARRRGARDDAAGLLGTFGLTDLAGERVERLPYGTRKRVELARAFVGRPRLVLLDEPLAGLNGWEKRELIETLRGLRATTDPPALMVIEHDMTVIRELTERVIVLNGGRMIAEGGFDAVSRDPAVLESYLGTEADRRPATSPVQPTEESA